MEEILDLQDDHNGEQHQPEEKIQYLIENGYQFDLGLYIGKAWELLKRDMGAYILYGFLAFLIAMAGGLIFAFIPFVGNLLSNLLSVLLFVGFYVYAFKVLNKGNQEFGDFFGGFEYLGKILVGNLLYFLFSFLMSLIIIIPLFMSIGLAVFTQSIEENISTFLTVFTPGLIISLVIAIIGFTYLFISYLWINNILLFTNIKDWNAL